MNEEAKQYVEQIKEGVLEELKKELPLRKGIFGGDDEDAKAKSLQEKKEKAVEYIKALYNGDKAGIKAMSEGTAADGGYLVPDYFASELVRVAGQYGVVRRNARIVPMAGKKTMKIPTGGSVIAYRVAEKAAITSSAPTLGQVTLTLQKLAVLIPLTNELLEDATVDTVDYLIELSAEALAKKEDDWGINGLGAGEGLFQDTNVNVVTMANGQDTYAETGFNDLIDVINKVDEGALSGAKWYMSFSVFNGLRKLKDTTGQYIIQNPGAGMPATIWNFPVEFSSVMPKTSDGSQASKKFIAFGNLKYMLFGDGKSVSVSVSDEASVTDTDGSTNLNLFEKDMSAVRVIERIDIELAEAAKAFAVLKTSAT